MKQMKDGKAQTFFDLPYAKAAELFITWENGKRGKYERVHIERCDADAIVFGAPYLGTLYIPMRHIRAIRAVNE